MRALVSLLILAAAPGFSAEMERGVPLFFFPNTGLTDPSIRFIVETPQLRAGFRADSAVFQAGGGYLSVRFAGADPGVTIEGSETLPGKVNFIIGSDPRGWKANLPTYRSILYRGLYPGVDMIYGGAGRGIKSTFTVAPGADPSQIRLEYSAADHVAIDGHGDLLIEAAGMQLREEAPEIYQESGGGRVHIYGRYRMTGPRTIGFEIDAFDASQPLVIDPIISYCTYLGGSAMGAVTGLAVDAGGNLYVAGWTEALDFPIAGAIQAFNKGGVDAFIAKLNAAGTALVYATYIGGRSDDRAAGIAVDSSGQAYVIGSTGSTNFPLVAQIRSSLGGAGRNAFALKVNAVGSALLYSTYLGGSTYDLGTAIAVDGSGNAYLAGDTQSADFPVLNAAQNRLGGAMDSFVTKLTSSGSLAFSTFLGGAANEHTGGVAVDSAGSVYVTGGTFSANFPILGAIQSVNRGSQDAFVTKISATGSSFVYSTYLGGNGGALGTPEQGNGIAVDTGGNAYIAGVTNSTNFPVTSGAVQTSFDGVQDAFVSKINASGNVLVYSTYLGGTSMDWASGIAVDTSGNASVAGYTSSFDFPTIGGVQSGFNGMYDAFVSTLSTSGAQLTFSTYYGGTGSDSANAIALDSNRNIYTGGQTNSFDLHLQGPIQSSNLGGSIGWLLRLGATNSPLQAVSVTPSSGSGSSQTFSLVYSDSNGATDISSAQVLFNTSIGFTNTCWIQVDPVHRTAYLANDGNTQILGPITLGTSATLQNSQCTLSGTGSSATTSGNIATVTLALTFQPAFAGTKNTYGYVQNAAGLNSGWQTLGTWTVPAGAPQVVSVTPSSGSGTTQTFSFVYSDPAGASDFVSTQALFNTLLGAANACWLWVDPVHAAAYLANDAGTQFVGPITLGTSATLQNSQCTLNGSGSSAILSGNIATVNLALTFLPAFTGPKNSYGFAQSTTGLSGWQRVGTWTAGQLQAVSVTPSSGSGSSQTFTFVYSDPNGGTDIRSAQALFNTVVSPFNTCYVLVDPVGNTAYLANDGFTGYLGPLTLGTSAILQNSQCIINGNGSSVSISGATATVNLAVTFQTAFAGAKNIYGLAQSASGANSGWQTLGTWTATGTQLQAVSVTPSSGSGGTQTFTFLYSDPNGGSDIASAQVLFNTVVSPYNTCYVLVDPVHDLAYLANDGFTGYLGPSRWAPPGHCRTASASLTEADRAHSLQVLPRP